MTQSDSTNRKFVLAKRPKGEPDDSTLRLETQDIPTPGKGQMLLRNACLSLDPYMRGRMSDAPSYAAPVTIGVLPAAFVLILTDDPDGADADRHPAEAGRHPTPRTLL